MVACRPNPTDVEGESYARARDLIVVLLHYSTVISGLSDQNVGLALLETKLDERSER